MIVILATGCTPKNSNQYISDNTFLLDTIVNVKIYDYEDEEIFKEVFEDIKDLEDLLSVHREGSDPYNINQKAGKEWVDISKETLEVLTTSQKIADLSNGYFDVTIGPLVSLWAIKPPEGHVPTPSELKDTLALTNYKKLRIDTKNSKAFLEEENMAINLGAIAKGYIADQVKENLVDKGITSGIINLGGNVVILGSKPDGSDFKVGIQNPGSERDDYLGTVEISDKAVVSSGTYERYFEYEGKRYHHILNPYTGFPQENSLIGVTVIADDSTYADAMSTTLFLLGLEDGLSLAEGMNKIQAIFVTKDKKVYVSSGLKAIFELEKDTEYVLGN